MQTRLEFTPIYRLLAVPEKYHNTPVKIIGFANIEFEGTAVYAHREDYEYGLGNSLWLDIPAQFLAQSKQLDRKYCIIGGIFDKNDTGHMALFNGAIKAIYRFDVWADPAKPRR